MVQSGTLKTTRAATAGSDVGKSSTQKKSGASTSKQQKSTISNVQQGTRAPTHVEGWRPKPKIIEFLNIADYSHQVNCSVPVAEPIFQPYPPEITFHGYEPYLTYETTLFLRNNDAVARRVKVVAPDTPYFSVSRIHKNGEDEGSKVAAGMEVSYKVRFHPQTVNDYIYDLVVCTEREKFIVPILAVGAAAILDFPAAIEFPPSAVKVEQKQSVFIRNVGQKAANFNLSTYEPFAIAPAHGYLAPGETLQCCVSFTPKKCERCEAELEIQYDTGRCVYSQLFGLGMELEVGLSQPDVVMVPTYVAKTSQKSFKIVNRSDLSVSFIVKQNATLDMDLSSATHHLMQLTSTEHAAHVSIENLDDEQQSPDDSEDEEKVFANSRAAVARKFRRLRNDVNLDKHFFENSNFTVIPSEGTVWPKSEMEVIVQFQPDHAREFEVVAYIDVQGRQERLPIVYKGKGLGPQAVFSYDVLDVGDTFINTLHQYEVELQNRGKIDAEFRLVLPETILGSKFSFEPDTGLLTAGEIQTIKVKLLSDVLGSFDEVFKWSIKGSSVPLTLQFTGRVVGPSYEVDTDCLAFGIVSYGFRYTKELTLCNTSEIPMRFSWRVPEDDPNAREFQIIPQKGSILPHGKR